MNHEVDYPSETGRVRTGQVKWVDGSGKWIGRVSFSVFDDIKVVETLQYEVLGDHQRQGIASELFRRLKAEPRYEGYELRASSDDNTTGGTALLDSLRAQKEPYHFPDCFKDNDKCVCPLGGRVRNGAE